jgi:hypothetical protein
VWGLVYHDEEGNLNWCTRDYKNKSLVYRVPIPVNATSEEERKLPFLISRPSDVPNLHFADVHQKFSNTSGCMFFKDALADMKGKKRVFKKAPHSSKFRQQLSEFEAEFDLYLN